MLTLSETFQAADRLAGIAWRMQDGPTAFRWRDALKMPASALAQFVAANPHASAEALYLFAVSDQPVAASWADLPPPLRVAIEIFRASFLAMARELAVDVLAGTPPNVTRLRPPASVRPTAELKRSPIVTGECKAPRLDPLADLLDTRMTTDKGRPARKGGAA